MQRAAVISWSRWPETCPYTYLRRDSRLLLETSMSEHGNQGEFLWPRQGQKTHHPLSCSASALRVPTVAASGAYLRGNKGTAHPSSDVLQSARLRWEGLRVTAWCLSKRSGQPAVQVGAEGCVRALGPGLVPVSPGEAGLSCGRAGMQLTQEREASVTE